MVCTAKIKYLWWVYHPVKYKIEREFVSEIVSCFQVSGSVQGVREVTVAESVSSETGHVTSTCVESRSH